MQSIAVRADSDASPHAPSDDVQRPLQPASLRAAQPWEAQYHYQQQVWLALRFNVIQSSAVQIRVEDSEACCCSKALRPAMIPMAEKRQFSALM